MREESRGSFRLRYGILCSLWEGNLYGGWRKELQMPNDRRTANLWNVTATGAVSSNIIGVFWPTGAGEFGPLELRTLWMQIYERNDFLANWGWRVWSSELRMFQLRNQEQRWFPGQQEPASLIFGGPKAWVEVKLELKPSDAIWRTFRIQIQGNTRRCSS